MKASLYTTTIALALAGTSTVALAQTATAPKAQAETGLETIVVTATKRSENLQSVPVAVTAISSAALTKAGVFETSDLNHAMPNLQVSSPYGEQQPNFSIRGIGVGTEFNANAASPVGVYVDEVYQTFRASHGQQLYDLNQIEVVRGPQGTLYGRNTTGGAVNFLTVGPKLQGTSGNFTLGYGNYNNRKAEGALEFTPIKGELGIRVAGTYTKADPYISNIAPAGQVIAINGAGAKLSNGTNPGGLESYGFRGTIRWKPSADIDLSLKGYAAKTTGGEEAPIASGFLNTNLIYRANTLFNSFLPAFATHIIPSTTTSLATAFQNTPNAAVFVGPTSDKQVNADSVGQARTQSDGVVLNAKFNITPHLKLISVTGYDGGEYQQLPNTDCDASPINLCSIGYNSTYHAFTQDLRFDYSNGPLKMIIGGFYGADVDHAQNRPDFFNALSLFNVGTGVNAPTYFNPAGFLSTYYVAANGNGGFTTATDPFPMPTGITATNNFTQTRFSTAIYGEGSYALTDKLKLTLGGRYTKDITKFDGLTTIFDDTGTARAISVSSFAASASNPLGWYFLKPVYQENGTTVAINQSTGGYSDLIQRGSSNRFSGRAIIDYKASKTVLLYASYSRGYRAGTFNGLAYGQSAQVYFVPPEQVNAYEGGIKSRWLDNTLQINASVFYYDYKGQQGQVVDATATANLVALDGHEKGLELEISYAPTRRLQLSAALGLLDSAYAHGINCPAGLAAPGSPHQIGNCVLAGSGQYVDVGGNPFPFAAKSSINLGADWDAYKTDSNKLSLHLDASYTGNFHYDSFGNYSSPALGVALANPVPNPAGGANLTTAALASGAFANGGGDFWMFNGRVTFTHTNYSLSFWMKNIADKTTYPYGIATQYLFGNDYRVRNQPRTFGGELTVKF